MSKIEDLGMGAANSATGQILGLAFGGIQDRRQQRQAQKLGDIQLGQNKAAADYSNKLAKEMWDYTNYENQVKHMENAGINVGLMYGGTGSGGTTAGAGSAGSVSGQSAGDPNAGVGMGLQMGAQLALMKAQKENIEADTRNKEAEGTGKGYENISKEIKGRIDTDTEAEQKDKIIGEAKSAATKGVIDERSQQDVLNKIHSDAVGTAIENTLKQANIQLSYTKIRQIEQDIANSIKELSLKGRAITVAEINSAWQETMARKGQSLASDGLDLKQQTDMINAILKAAGIASGKGMVIE